MIKELFIYLNLKSVSYYLIRQFFIFYKSHYLMLILYSVQIYKNMSFSKSFNTIEGLILQFFFNIFKFIIKGLTNQLRKIQIPPHSILKPILVITKI